MHLFFPGVDPPFPTETLASLTQRIAQRHDISFLQFHKIFETTKDPDMDFCMTAKQLDIFGERCRISHSVLELIRRSCCRFVEQPYLKDLLLRRKRDDIDYRFCPHCWRGDHTPYLRLDWRFRDATLCRIHGEPLEDRCTSCSMPLATHRPILGGSFHPPPVQNLAICFFCRYDLRQVSRANSSFDAQPSWKQVHFQNAIISAILHGHFQTEADGVKRSLEDLPAYLQKVGMEEKSKKVHLFAGLTEKEAKTLGRALNKAVRDATWVEPRNGEKLSMPHSIEVKRFFMEIRASNGKSRVK